MSILPRKDRKDPPFSTNIQHDVAEFLTVFFEFLDVELQKLFTNKVVDHTYILEKDFVTKNLTIDFCEVYKCSKCLTNRYKLDKHTMLEVDIRSITNKSCAVHNLHDLISNMSNREDVLKLECTKCRLKNDHVKTKLLISNTPSILIVQLQRYDVDRQGIAIKRNDNVYAPENLDMSDFFE